MYSATRPRIRSFSIDAVDALHVDRKIVEKEIGIGSDLLENFIPKRQRLEGGKLPPPPALVNSAFFVPSMKMRIVPMGASSSSHSTHAHRLTGTIPPPAMFSPPGNQ